MSSSQTAAEQLVRRDAEVNGRKDQRLHAKVGRKLPLFDLIEAVQGNVEDLRHGPLGQTVRAAQDENVVGEIGKLFVGTGFGHGGHSFSGVLKMWIYTSFDCYHSMYYLFALPLTTKSCVLNVLQLLVVDIILLIVVTVNTTINCNGIIETIKGGCLVYRIRSLRKEKGLSQQEVADYLHITQQCYSKIETGRMDITGERLVLLARLYDVTVDYLLGLSEE